MKENFKGLCTVKGAKKCKRAFLKTGWLRPSHTAKGHALMHHLAVWFIFLAVTSCTYVPMCSANHASYHLLWSMPWCECFAKNYYSLATERSLLKDHSVLKTHPCMLRLPRCVPDHHAAPPSPNDFEVGSSFSPCCS